MAIRHKATLIASALVAALLGVLVWLFTVFLNPDRYRAELVSYLQEQTGRPVEVGHLALTLFSPSIQIDDLRIKNLPPFPAGYVLRVGRIVVQLNRRALLYGHLVIHSVLLISPEVNLISDPNGRGNFTISSARTTEQYFPVGEIGNVAISKGQLIASNLLPSDSPGPIIFEAHEISGEIEHVNLAAMIDPSSDSMGGQGFIRADRLSLGTVDAKNLTFKVQLWAKQIFLADVKAEVFGGNAVGALFFDLSGKRPAFRANTRFNSIDVAQLLEPFEGGRGKMNGKMEGDLILAGEIQHSQRPLAGIRGNGHVTVHNGKIPTLQLNASLMKLLRYNNLGPAKENPASFKFISSDLEIANLRVESRTIDIDGYGVDIDGSGSINVDGSDEVSYAGVAQITTRQGFFTNTVARLAGATLKDGKLLFPFRVGGTVDTPLFSAAVHH